MESLSNEYLCPECGERITAADINNKNALGFCRQCECLFDLDEDLKVVSFESLLTRLPKNVTLYNTLRGYKLHFKHSKIHGIVLLVSVLFGIVFLWSFVSPFIDVEGEIVMIWPFLLFFAFLFLIGVCNLITAFYLIWGYTSMDVNGRKVVVFQGLGNLGRTKKFIIEPDTMIFEHLISGNNKKGAIQIGDSKKNRFGSALTDEQRHYIIDLLKSLQLDG